MKKIIYLLLFFILLTFKSFANCIEENPTGTKFEKRDPSLDNARYYFKNKDYQAAFYEFYQIHLSLYKSKTIRVRNEIATARGYIGWMYQNGFCVQKNYQKANEWYKLSINTSKTVDPNNLWVFGLLSELNLLDKYKINSPEEGIMYLSKAFTANKTYEDKTREVVLLSDLINNIYDLYKKDKVQFLAYSLAFMKYFDFDDSKDEPMKTIKKNTSFDDKLTKNGLKNKFYQIKHYLGTELFNGINTEKDLKLAGKYIFDAGRNGNIKESGIYAAKINEKGLGGYKKNKKYALDWIDWSLTDNKDKEYIDELNDYKSSIMSELTDKDIEEMFGYKTQKSYNFGKKNNFSPSYLDKLSKFDVTDENSLREAIDRGIDEKYLKKSFGKSKGISSKERQILLEFLNDEKDASDKFFTSALDIKEKRDKENAKKAEENRKRRAEERAKELAKTPYKIIISCESFDKHTNLPACLLGNIDSNIKITKDGSSYVYKPWDLSRLGNESYNGLEFNISGNSSVGASNVNEYLILKIKVYDRITNKLIKTVSAGYLDYAYVKLR